MKTQMKKAGIVPAEERLNAIGREIIAKERNIDKASALLWLQIGSDAALLWHLFEPFRKEAARRLLAPLVAETKQNRSGQPQRDIRLTSAAPSAGHVEGDSQNLIARAINPDAGAIVNVLKDHGSTVPASGAHPVVSESMKRVVRQTLLDTFRVTDRQGSRIPIGDIYLASVDTWAERMGRNAWINARERELMLMISAAAATKVAYRPSDARVRDVFTETELMEFIERAGGIAKHPELSGFYESLTEGAPAHA